MIFSRPGGGVLEVADEPRTAMLRFAQVSPEAPEAGGVLLGRRIVGRHDVVVDAVTVPMPEDRRSRAGFFRSRRPHQAAVRSAWEKSGGTCHYLGEWHTHPEAVPAPSMIDVLDWRRHLVLDQYMGASLFFVIVGTATTRVWEGRRRSLRLLQMAGPARPEDHSQLPVGTE